MRECNECTACCEGWLSGEVKEIKFYSGKPCHFLKGKQQLNGCSIYDERPQSCKDYKCEWLSNPDIPEWMFPAISKTILTKKIAHGFEFYELIEAGQRMDPAVLSWVVMHCVNNQYNLRYIVDGGIYKIGMSNFWQDPNI